MEKRKRIGGDGEIHLPREIIHRIQSFLNEREAARTSLLSKWWYSAWSTPPNLAFEIESPKSIGFAKKTIQRYEDEKLSLQSLKVMTRLKPSGADLLLSKEFIAKAMKLGADDLDISFWNRSFVLPDEVFQSKTLARLQFSGFTLNLPPWEKGLMFPKLKSLTLIHLTVKGDLVRDLISRCPSIEILKLHEIKSCYGDHIDMKNGFEKLQLGKLEALHLSSSLNLEGSLARFSCLKQLVLTWGYDYTKDVRICSRSLEEICISLPSDKILSAEFDVPNLRKFVLVGGSPSSRLDFKSCREWESEIHFYCYRSDDITPSWFSSLNQLLKMFRNSRVFLSIDVNVNVKVKVKVKEESGGDVVVFETLRLSGKEANSDFLDNLFSICRPIKSIVVQDYMWCNNPREKELLEVDCKKMVDEVMNVKPLEERFGKYSSLSWKRSSPARVYFQFRWNLNH